MRELRGRVEASDLRVAVVASRFNELVVAKLVEGALACLRKHGIADEDLALVWVPGSFELPVAARRMAGSGAYHAVVCLGAVIRGETAHFDYVADAAATGIREASADTGIPVIFGVLTTDTLEQAMERAGGAHGNKGWDAAEAAMEMASLMERLPEPEAAREGDR